MSHHRAAYRNHAVPNEPFDAEAGMEADSTPNLEDAERVHLALDRLDPNFREVLTLHFLEDLSIDETAEIIGVATGTVKSRLFHAKKALKKILSREDGI
jgi:RNA polymerase sigma-70 factor (ECF subfamily)